MTAKTARSSILNISMSNPISENPLRTEKARIRREVLRIRDALDPSTREIRSALIKERLFSLPEFHGARVIFLFASFRSEVSTIPQIEEFLRLGKKIVLPHVNKHREQLRLYEIKDISEISPGYMGIPEPETSEERLREINDVDIVVMPGAAFDLSGNRLGYGGSYYDKLLSGLRKKIPLIAIAYDEQIRDFIPTEPHDIRVHMIVTDKRTIKCPDGV
ncbi:MAG: 5-formyltetrahydrofolate cyclo-ligase [Thermodesulfovibrionales bacterium]